MEYTFGLYYHRVGCEGEIKLYGNDPHKYIHVLLCCYEHQWGELRYVKRRKNKNDNSIIHEAEKGINFYNYYPDYKSQEHRYSDVQ